MSKKIYFLAFVADDNKFGHETNADEIIQLLSGPPAHEGLSDFMIWDGIESVIADHIKSGPLDLAYLTGIERPQAEESDGPALRDAVLTSDIGLFIRDSVDGKPFSKFDLGDEISLVGRGHVEDIDASDASNLIVSTSAGEQFRISIVRTGSFASSAVEPLGAVQASKADEFMWQVADELGMASLTHDADFQLFCLNLHDTHSPSQAAEDWNRR
ncbi:MAG: hypothetical protein ACREEJ_01115 [Ensifer adhaerens]